ncbi:MAG: sigma-70 family RNA polymerase sigma factor [Pirellulales bacterium]
MGDDVFSWAVFDATYLSCNSFMAFDPMPDELSFVNFLDRIRAGDDKAAETLVRRYEPVIRRVVRARMEDARLKRSFDSVDVSQSVLASFFARMADGQFNLDDPDDLVRLLVAMARNKTASLALREHCVRRDSRRIEAISPGLLENVADQHASPSEALSRRELLEQLRTGLNDEERQIADLRGQGLNWSEVAEKLGGSGQARRMQLTRGIERVGRQLGFAK